MPYIISDNLDFEEIKNLLSGDSIPIMPFNSIELEENKAQSNDEHCTRKISKEAFLFLVGLSCASIQGN